MKHLVIVLASFAATVAVFGSVYLYMQRRAELPDGPKEQPATAPARPSGSKSGPARKSPFKTLEPGLELAEFSSSIKSELGDSKIRVLRIDPTRFDFRLLCAAAANPPGPQTARQWCKRDALVAAINASMLPKDGKTSLGIMQTRGYVNNAKSQGIWRAFLGFDPKDKKAQAVRIMNRDIKESSVEQFKKDYDTVVQGARLIPKGGKYFLFKDKPNNIQKWSAAAIGIDKSDRGRVLFIHVRSPYSMEQLVSALIPLRLNLETLILTGAGPEAQLFVASGGKELEFFGSYKTGVRQDDKNDRAAPIPNVIAIVRRPSPPGG